MTDEQIKHMTNRFLAWKLPQDFRPDAGISFEPEFNKEWNVRQGKPPQRHEPSGTNLFDATQAEAMIRYMAEGMTAKPEFAWLGEAPGQQYLTARKIGGCYTFKWTKDHLEATRFYNPEQADLMMMAVRELDKELFGFAVTLGDAKVTEHSWLPMHRQET